MVMRQKILVTGSDGQLGREFQLLAAEFPVFEFIFLNKDQLSITDQEAIRTLFHQKRPGYCLNCAAYTAVDKAETDRQTAWEVNAQGPAFLASACKEFNAKFLHISTDYVFDGKAESPYATDAATNPQGVYGATKLEGEQRVLTIHPESLIIRTSWVYSVFGKNFVKTMIRLMQEKPELNVVNDQFGSPTWAADLANAVLQIISGQQWGNGVFHYCNRGIISWYDFAKKIAELIQSSCKINPIPSTSYPTPARRPAYSALDTSRMEKEFGIEMADWDKSLQACLQRLARP
jgi:dTDP-4-dehydrorhamnose reductase